MPSQAKDIFEAESKSLRELLSENGLGLYLPPYQRPYGWNAEKVEKLLGDTLHGLAKLPNEPDSFTFLGTIITIHDSEHTTVKPIIKSEVPSRVLSVIDGQQRVSTLLLLTLQLHNLISTKAFAAFKGKEPKEGEFGRKALLVETNEILEALDQTFMEVKRSGDSPVYPRLIRAFSDQWSKSLDSCMYESPVARVQYEYGTIINEQESTAIPGRRGSYRPKPRAGVGEGEKDLIARFIEMERALKKLIEVQEVEEYDELPLLTVLSQNTDFQRSLFNHELDQNLVNFLQEVDKGHEAELARLLMIAAFALNRIALTVVKGKDEDYAFTIFESLNTTGEPLTAFETFLPRVVSAEDIADYHGSIAQEHMKHVQQHLNEARVGKQLQRATSDLIISFALAESGKKLSKNLPDQRSYLRDSFDLVRHTRDGREDYLRHFRDVSEFIRWSWNGDAGKRLSDFKYVSDSGDVELCLSFLEDLRHTIAIAPLARFYSAAVNEPDEERARRESEFGQALRAITAFTLLWRSSRRTTDNIDGQYRSIMNADPKYTDARPLARAIFAQGAVVQDEPSVDEFVAELAARLSAGKGGIADRATYADQVSRLPIHSVSKPVTRMLLLAAFDNAVIDPDTHGQLVRGPGGTGAFMHPRVWDDIEDYCVDHIVPEDPSAGWRSSLFDNKELVQRLGNLVLVPKAAIPVLQRCSWEQKRAVYAALGSATVDEASSWLASVRLESGVSVSELAPLHKDSAPLRAVSRRVEDLDAAFIEERGARLAALAYDAVVPWLRL